MKAERKRAIGETEQEEGINRERGIRERGRDG